MLIAYIVGTPESAKRLAKSYTYANARWDIVPIDVRSDRADVTRVWPTLYERLREDALDGRSIHVLAYHNNSDKKPMLEKLLQPFVRVTWLDVAKLVKYGKAEYNQYLDDTLAFESDWHDQLCPKDFRDPLLLPEQHFRARGESKNLWKRSYDIRRGGTETFTAVSKLRDTFINDYRKSHSRYVDARYRAFSYGGERHGNVVDHRRWKFSYCIDPRFHYDVSDTHGNWIELNDPNGELKRSPKHLNVDCHGYIRLNTKYT